jgi:DNA-binding CsgD family transcriptional regulator
MGKESENSLKGGNDCGPTVEAVRFSPDAQFQDGPFAGMSVRDKEALTLRYGGHSYQQIAGLMRTSKKTAHKHVRKAEARLRANGYDPARLAMRASAA